MTQGNQRSRDRVHTGDLKRVSAGAMGLGAFAVAVLAGLTAGVDASSVIIRAMLCLMVGYPVGLAIGAIAQHVVFEHVRAYQKANPITTPGDRFADDQEFAQQQDDDADVLIV